MSREPSRRQRRESHIDRLIRKHTGADGEIDRAAVRADLAEIYRVEPDLMADAALGRQKRGRHPWLKPLDWVDVPGLFARAMQQDGWTWRSDVVWVKPSALPESV